MKRNRKIQVYLPSSGKSPLQLRSKKHNRKRNGKAIVNGLVVTYIKSNVERPSS